MKHRTRLFTALGLAHAFWTPAHAQTSLEVAMQVIGDLANVNGQALACADLKTARRAKDLMLAHAPKTARFGSIFEEGTQQSYVAQIKTSTACPDASDLSLQVDALVKRLQTALPVTSTAKP